MGSGPRGVLAAIAITLVDAPSARADEVAVPVELQAELLTKVAAYDRNMTARAAGRVHILIVERAGDADSGRTAAQMKKALGGVERVVGLPHDETILDYAGAAALASECRARHASIAYLSSGLGGELPQIRAALEGVDVLSAAAVASYVPGGIVLGFDLVSGKPKLLIQLGQARRQNVALKAEVLKLMKVFE
jgi:hypothetical protein